MKTNDKKDKIVVNGKSVNCPMDLAMRYIGGKWKPIILWHLNNGPKLFGELKRLMPKITNNTLFLQLKSLLKDGIIAREVYEEIPPRAEFSLSPEGKTLLPAIEALALWGRTKSEKHK